MSNRCWLVKTEADCYSIDDLQRDRRTCWDGVRNYQARNFMRDEMMVGDKVLVYHSGGASPDQTGVAGIARVAKTAYADHTALDPKEQHFDSKSTEENPIWYMVDLAFVKRFSSILPLQMLKAERRLAGMPLLQRGQRLSVMPVSPQHFDMVVEMAGSSTIRR